MAFSGSVIVHTAVPVVTLNYTFNNDGSASFELTRDTNAYGRFGGTFVVTVKDSNGKTGSITKANNNTHNYSGSITATIAAGTFSTSGTVSYTVSATCTACTSESTTNYVTNKSMGSYTWSTSITVSFYRNQSSSDTSIYKETYTTGDSGNFFGKNLASLGYTGGDFGAWTNTGYILLGWSTDRYATSKMYDTYSGIADWWINENAPSINLYAIWKAKTVTITFDMNDNSERRIDETFTYGVANQAFGHNTTGSCPNHNHTGSSHYGESGQFGQWSREGYELLGWSTDKYATSKMYDTYSGVDWGWINENAGTINLYAVWKAKTVTIIFHLNDGGEDEKVEETFTYGISNQAFGHNASGTCPSHNHTGSSKYNESGQFGEWDREGYELLGWASSSTATSKDYDTYSGVYNKWINENSPSINLYAVWKFRNNCYVRINGTYKPGIMYIRENGVYKIGLPYIRTSGAYKLGQIK